MKRICILHAGTHKTGTTSIQALLSRNTVAFARDGIYFPSAGRPTRLLESEDVGHHNIPWELNDDARFDPSAGSLADLVAEITAAPQEIAIVTSEGFEFLYEKPAALDQIANALDAAGFRVCPLFYLREQSDYAASLYGELLKHGLKCTPDAFIEAIRRDGKFSFIADRAYQFRYGPLLDAWARVFGRANVIVRPFDTGQDNVALHRDFVSVFGAFGTAPNIDSMVLPQRLNRSGSQDVLFSSNDLDRVFSDDRDYVERYYYSRD